MKRTHRKCAIVALLVCLGVLVQSWAALQGEANFGSDEAIMGLMALHSLEGRIPVYFYGQHYGGNFEPLVATGFLYALGHGTWQLRLPNILLFACFLIVNILLLQRMWDTRQSLMSLLLLAIPSWAVLIWFYRPILGFSVFMSAGTAIMLLTEVRITSNILNAGRFAFIGVLLGLGLWVNSMMIVYATTWILVYMLSSPEWRTIHERLHVVLSRVGIRVTAVTFPFAVCVAGFGIVAFFSGSCNPKDVFAVAASLSKLVLCVVILLVGTIILCVSRRRRQVISGAFFTAVGGLAGSLPQLYAIVVDRVWPTTALLPSCPVGAPVRGRLLLSTLLPSLVGVRRSLAHIPKEPPVVAILSLAAVAIASCGILAFLWQHRRSLVRLVTLSPTEKGEIQSQTLILWLGIPIGLALFGSNTVDRWSVRYLLVSWQAGVIMLALSLDWLLGHTRRFLSMAVIMLWILHIIVVGYGQLHREWTGRPLAVESVRQLEAYLVKHHTSGGYADYWIAYALDYLTAERIILAPFNFDRYPEYTETVEGLPQHAYVLPQGVVPDDHTHVGALISYLELDHPAGPVSDRIVTHLAQQTVIDRQHIGSWDVWLVH